MRRERDRKEPELDLLPIMNLFVALIPFLLVGTAFFHMAALNVSVPTQTDELVVEEQAKKKKNIKVVMTVQLTQKGFKVFGMSEDLSNSELNRLTKTIGKVRGKFNYKKLAMHFARVKKQYSKSDTVILVPEKNIDYSTIIQTIDTARKYKFKDKERFMFTNVVVSSRV